MNAVCEKFRLWLYDIHIVDRPGNDNGDAKCKVGTCEVPPYAHDC